jgi:hypothetical protein
VPAAFRGRFLAGFQRASHSAQDFGAGQSHGAAVAGDPPHAVAERIAMLSHDVFGQAFINAARPSLAICAGIMVLAAVFGLGFRGGRSAESARQSMEPATVRPQPDAA